MYGELKSTSPRRTVFGADLHKPEEARTANVAADGMLISLRIQKLPTV
ncbi:hypothetical protein OHAE_285 [Ochrobactrum soli]|uniref:Uncharacterized protein n=1 Tax=Ochrobactrum soli TaxID=2448455 RepID=A0A2P9HJZ8_9HYPH|nr:hypothetical protein OHAE_285 [[Ochrobactrum] soli]